MHDTATQAIMDMLEVLSKNKTLSACKDMEVDFPAFNNMIWVKDARDLEKTFIVK